MKTFDQCVTIEIYFTRSTKRQIQFQKGDVNINNLQFLKHSDRVKAHAVSLRDGG